MIRVGHRLEISNGCEIRASNVVFFPGGGQSDPNLVMWKGVWLANPDGP